MPQKKINLKLKENLKGFRGVEKERTYNNFNQYLLVNCKMFPKKLLLQKKRKERNVCATYSVCSFQLPLDAVFVPKC